MLPADTNKGNEIRWTKADMAARTVIMLMARVPMSQHVGDYYLE